MTVTSAIARCTDAALAALRRGAQYITVRNTLRLSWEFVKLLTSGTFLCCMMGPFAAWAGLLLWLHARYPTEIVQAVAAGPGIVIFLWIVAAMAWMALSASAARVRQMLSLGIACVSPRGAGDPAPADRRETRARHAKRSRSSTLIEIAHEQD